MQVLGSPDSPTDQLPFLRVAGITGPVSRALIERRYGGTFDRSGFEALLRGVDFIGISAYAATQPGSGVNSMQDAAFTFFKVGVASGGRGRRVGSTSTMHHPLCGPAYAVPYEASTTGQRIGCVMPVCMYDHVVAPHR